LVVSLPDERSAGGATLLSDIEDLRLWSLSRLLFMRYIIEKSNSYQLASSRDIITSTI
jgi:hypothetical protein